MDRAEHMKTGEMIQKEEKARILSKTRKPGDSFGAFSRDLRKMSLLKVVLNQLWQMISFQCYPHSSIKYKYILKIIKC